MFSVDEDFLKEEVRCDFLVPEKMKRAWAAQLKTLVEIDRICKKHSIKYFASYGTLLGAIRHKGYIPWDDDVDLVMLRPDYMKFLSIIEDFKHPYRVKSMYCQSDFNHFHTVISNSTETKLSWDEERMREFFGCPFIVGIDICPLDYLPIDEGERKLQQLIYHIGYYLSRNMEESGSDYFKGNLELFNKHTGLSLSVDNPEFHEIIMHATDAIAMHAQSDDSEDVVYYPSMIYSQSPAIMPKKWYSETINLPFENISIPCPIESELVIKKIYGEGYMTPVIGSSHDYPFYKTQEEYFRFLGKDI